MIRPFKVHDVDAILDYAFDWSAWLDDGASIADSDWSAPDGVTLSDDLIAGSVTQVRVTIADKDLRGNVVLVNHVTASDGQEDDREITLHLTQGAVHD